MNTILGVDFDNTLACYDGVFHAEAVKRDFIPASVPGSRQAVRDYLRSVGREDDFTLLQGYIYGPGMVAARVYPGALECLSDLIARGVTVYIVSHKTPYPYLGPRYDLHQSARSWLREQGFYRPGLLKEENVFLEQSKAEKLRRIARLGCTHFVDDLPEFLDEPAFPAGTKKMLFAPEGETPQQHSGENRFAICRSWKTIRELLLADSAVQENTLHA